MPSDSGKRKEVGKPKEKRRTRDQIKRILNAELRKQQEFLIKPLEPIEPASEEGDKSSSAASVSLSIKTKEGVTERIKDINAALQALEDGEYGICLKCGEKIPLKRLESCPWATLCTDCKTMEDFEKKKRGGRASVIAEMAD